jgi:lysozyme family protein
MDLFIASPFTKDGLAFALEYLGYATRRYFFTIKMDRQRYSELHLQRHTLEFTFGGVPGCCHYFTSTLQFDTALTEGQILTLVKRAHIHNSSKYSDFSPRDEG